MATRYDNPSTRHFNKDTKDFLSGGQLFFFETGTTTPKDTFSDSDGLIANTNPVILDATGLEPDIFGEGSYRIVLQSKAGTDSGDNIQQWERDPVELTEAGTSSGFSDWLSTVDYGVNDIVEGSDGNFYISIQTPNINNDPVGATAAFWTEFDLLKRWNNNETYNIGDPVTQNGKTYISVTDTNIGNDPDSFPDEWEVTGLTSIWDTSITYAADQTVRASSGVIYQAVIINSGNDPVTDDRTNWIPPTPPFRGCMVTTTGVNAQVLTLTDVEYTQWDLELYDTDDIHDLVTEPGRLTVPTGATKVKLVGYFLTDFNTTAEIFLTIYENNNFGFAGSQENSRPSGGSDRLGIAYFSPVLDVVGGDFFDLRVRVSSTTNGSRVQSQAPGSPQAFFSMEILE